MTPYEVADSFAKQLQAAGVRATTDPRKVVAPALLIAPPQVEFDLACGGTATWTVYAVSSSPGGDAEAWRQLDLLLAVALKVLQPERAEPASWAPDNDAAPMPAYRLTLTTAVEWENP
jgi:hypothetical protein